MSVRAWVRDRVDLRPDVLTPARLLWDDYCGYCELWGFEPEPPAALIRGLRAEDGVAIVEGGRGRVRRAVSGVCLKALENRRSA